MEQGNVISRLRRLIARLDSAGWPVALAIPLPFGATGFYAVFVDLSPSEAPWMRITFIIVWHTAAPLIVGAIVPSRWYVAVLTAWGPAAMGMLGLRMLLKTGSSPPRWEYLLSALVGIPAVGLAAGYVGMRLSRMVLGVNDSAS